MRNFLWILLGIVVILALMQLITIDKTNPPVDQQKDFLNIQKTPTETASLIRNACYDCHSNETEYPWYSSYAPFSWMIKKHIDNGRGNLNFSTWADYSEEKKMYKLDEIIEEIEMHKMPIKSYANMHPKAQLTREQLQSIVDYSRSLMKQN